MSDTSSSLSSFVQGLLLGQISVAVLVFAFIKFFIFGEIPEPPSRSRRFSTNTSARLAPKKSASVIRPVTSLSSASILSKTYYNVNAHQPESVDWFNVLVAQTIAQLRNDAQHEDAILTTLSTLLNGELRPDFLGEIKVTEINLGEEFPIFSNCRIMPVMEPEATGRPPSSSSNMQGSAGPRLQARMDVDLADNVTIGIETKLILNYPKPMVAVMPVALAISVVRFSGTLSISFIPSPSQSPADSSFQSDSHHHQNNQKPKGASLPRAPTLLTFSFQPDYRLELSTRSLLGSKSRLQDIPKIAQLVEARLHAWFDERCVEPRFQRVVLPSLWPRRENAGTRGEPEAEPGADAGADAGAGVGPAADGLGVAGGRHASARQEQDADDFAVDYSPYLGPQRDGPRDGLRNRRTRPDRDSGDEQRHRYRQSDSSFELPGSMPGTLPL